MCGAQRPSRARSNPRLIENSGSHHAAEPFTTAHATRIVALAIQNRLPTMFSQGVLVESGGLMSYSANLADLARRAAVYVDKILKGAKPADLPVEQPIKFEFVINLKT